jgi:hippurate hydrolase
VATPATAFRVVVPLSAAPPGLFAIESVTGLAAPATTLPSTSRISTCSGGLNAVPAVVTVGSIHGGTKHNIIPDTAHLQLTVRSYKDEVRQRLLAGISRIARAEAAAAAAPKEPEVRISESTPSTYNDPALTKRLVAALAAQLGADHLQETPPVMGGEDFSEYGRAGVPAVMLGVGAVEPRTFAEARAAGRSLPSLHSSLFAPDREPTLKTAATALAVSALELLGRR